MVDPRISGLVTLLKINLLNNLNYLQRADIEAVNMDADPILDMFTLSAFDE